MSLWLFGYGSLIWRPDFAYVDRAPARLHGYSRRFWQGSHDHRGVPEAPGRVVTLIPDAHAYCDGVAYCIDADTAAGVLSQLDHREKNGYARLQVPLQLHDRGEQRIEALVYLATAENFAYLGPAPIREIAHQIAHSRGPSGHNQDYLFDLAHALRDLQATDTHVFELEQAVRALQAASRQSDTEPHRAATNTTEGESVGHCLQP